LALVCHLKYLSNPRRPQTFGLPVLHHASVNVDLVTNLIELPNAHNVGCYPRDEVHPFERSRLAILAHEHVVSTGSTRTGADSMCTFKKRIFEGMYMLEKPGMTIGEGIAGRSMQKCMDKKLLEWGMFSKPIKIDILDSSSESKEEIPPPAAMQQGLLSSSEDYNAEARRKRRNKNKKREKKPDNTSDDEYQMKARRYQR
jgi:hypothetical protein